MKPHEIRDMTTDDIRHRMGQLREEYFKLSFRNAVHKIDNPLQLRGLRHDLARCLTILKEKEKSQKEI